jgi:hypothetical protein
MNKIVRSISVNPHSFMRINVRVQNLKFLQRLCTSLAPGVVFGMTEYLIAARAAVILWTTLAVMPAELVFNAIEAELARRGIKP